MSGNDKVRRGSGLSTSAKKVFGALAGKTDDANLTPEQRERLKAEKRIMDAKAKVAKAEQQAKRSETKVKTKEEQELRLLKEEEARKARLQDEKAKMEARKHADDYEAKLAKETVRNLELEKAGLPILKEFLKAQRSVNSAPSELKEMILERDRLDKLIKNFSAEVDRRENAYSAAIAGVKNFLGRDDALSTYLTLMSEKKEEWQEAVLKTKESEKRPRSESGSSQKSFTSSYDNNKSAGGSRRASSNESQKSHDSNMQKSDSSGERKPPPLPKRTGLSRKNSGSDTDIL